MSNVVDLFPHLRTASELAPGLQTTEAEVVALFAKLGVSAVKSDRGDLYDEGDLLDAMLTQAPPEVKAKMMEAFRASGLGQLFGV